jgi:hypothetical protein
VQISTAFLQAGDQLLLLGLWPSRSYSLSLLGFFLWGHLQECVYNNPHSTEEMKTSNDSSISHDILHQIAHSMIKKWMLAWQPISTLFVTDGVVLSCTY